MKLHFIEFENYFGNVKCCKRKSIITFKTVFDCDFPRLLFIIALDSLMGSLLISIVITADLSSSLMIAASLSIEIGFLELTLSIVLKGQKI